MKIWDAFLQLPSSCDKKKCEHIVALLPLATKA